MGNNSCSKQLPKLVFTGHKGEGWRKIFLGTFSSEPQIGIDSNDGWFFHRIKHRGFMIHGYEFNNYDDEMDEIYHTVRSRSPIAATFNRLDLIGSVGLIVVFDASIDKSTLEYEKEQLQRMLSEDAVVNVPILLYVHVTETIDQEKTFDEFVTWLDLDTLKSRPHFFFQMLVDEEDTISIAEGFSWLVTAIQAKHPQKQESASKSGNIHRWITSFKQSNSSLSRDP